MKTKETPPPVGPRYSLVLRFNGRGEGSRMDIFNAVRELGTFRVRRDAGAADILELRSALKKSALEKRLRELARLKRSFYFRIEEARPDER
ncbi:MAG: hypothetical protein FD189_2010 [Elusimicrobia bacterium]|nr:MAG: hypothetical protein FD154_2137 [Elusimicrobiota bacterium]KAF0154250.1 MAG: hypothetical protein FD189_2010 [Elusimicrobiota bacterium]